MDKNNPKSKKLDLASLTGTWRITEMETWDRDAFESDGPALIRFEKNGQGEMNFIYVKVELDWRWDETADHVAFTFAGFDELTETSGRGWTKIQGNQMEGKIYFHMGDESGFKAEKGTKLLKSTRPAP